MIKEITNSDVKKEIAGAVLYDLPEWFGIPEYTQDYIRSSGLMPFFAAYHNEEPVGFIALKETSPYTMEIYCMGVKKAFHRQGYGKALLIAAEKYIRAQGYYFLQVKTVQQGRYKEYDMTNAFYKAMGFYEFEVFPKLWDEWNPCQIFVKSL